MQSEKKWNEETKRRVIAIGSASEGDRRSIRHWLDGMLSNEIARLVGLCKNFEDAIEWGRHAPPWRAECEAIRVTSWAELEGEGRRLRAKYRLEPYQLKQALMFLWDNSRTVLDADAA